MHEWPKQGDPVALSADGEARREGILVAALAAGRLRRQRRLIGRSAGVAALALLCVWVGWQARPSAPTPIAVGPAPQLKNLASQPEVVPVLPTRPRSPQIEISVVRTDRSLIDDWRVPATPPTWNRLDDNGLLAELAADGTSAVLVVHEGRTVLWTSHRPTRN